MKLTTKLMLTTAMVAAMSTGSAIAADLSIPPQPAPVVAAPTNWDGPYIGASIGWGWGTASVNGNNAVVGNFTDSASLNGFLIGAQLGYNFHLADQLVGGIEGDIDWVNGNGTFHNFTPNSMNSSFEGSIRARLGWDVDSILPYVEAGVAFANANSNFFNNNINNTRVGWTVGVGVEFMLAQQLSANVEYRFSDYGDSNFNNANTNMSTHLSTNTFRVGLNYHF